MLGAITWIVFTWTFNLELPGLFSFGLLIWNELQSRTEGAAVIQILRPEDAGILIWNLRHSGHEKCSIDNLINPGAGLLPALDYLCSWIKGTHTAFLFKMP